MGANFRENAKRKAVAKIRNRRLAWLAWVPVRATFTGVPDPLKVAWELEARGHALGKLVKILTALVI